MNKNQSSKKKLVIDNSGDTTEDKPVTPYSIERVDIDNDIFSLKVPIFIHKDRLSILDEILEFTGQHLKSYMEDALFNQIDGDLESPEELGEMFCSNLKRIWNKNKEDNDGRVLGKMPI